MYKVVEYSKVCAVFVLGLNTTTEIMTSSTIIGSGNCCSIGLNIPDTGGMVDIFIETNNTEKTPLRVSSR
jgi:hypothetical protein